MLLFASNYLSPRMQLDFQFDAVPVTARTRNRLRLGFGE
jgi:hypothetical protein